MKSKITKQDKMFIFMSTILLIIGIIFPIFMSNFNELIKTKGGTIFSAQVTIQL